MNFELSELFDIGIKKVSDEIEKLKSNEDLNIVLEELGMDKE